MYAKPQKCASPNQHLKQNAQYVPIASYFFPLIVQCVCANLPAEIIVSQREYNCIHRPLSYKHAFVALHEKFACTKMLTACISKQTNNSPETASEENKLISKKKTARCRRFASRLFLFDCYCYVTTFVYRFL